jgi:hypothetical protein
MHPPLSPRTRWTVSAVDSIGLLVDGIELGLMLGAAVAGILQGNLGIRVGRTRAPGSLGESGRFTCRHGTMTTATQPLVRFVVGGA